MTISDYISSEDKKNFCDKCIDCVCTRSCVIYRKAEFKYDKIKICRSACMKLIGVCIADDADTIDISFDLPIGGAVKCHFEVDVQEASNDN